VSTVAEGFRRWSPQRYLKGLFTVARRKFIRRFARESERQRHQADAFYLKCYSPQSAPLFLQIELVTDVPVFRTAVEITPGWNEHVIDAEPLLNRSGQSDGRLQISIAGDREARLIFTWLHLVQFRSTSAPSHSMASPASSATPATAPTLPTDRPAPSTTTALIPATHIKCVAWDLDNTLWHGVIGDVGRENIQPNQEMLDLIPRLDERGILQTIVSKNHYDVAWPAIEELGLADYFLYPAIHWGPKSESLRQIAAELNINIDTFAVVDDSEFERREIQTSLPQVRTFDPADGAGFLQNAEFDVPVSKESRDRRQKYLAESQRRRIQQTWRGDYDEFLRNCRMQVLVRRPRQADHTRCVELLQRSNQFNLSGRRYDAAAFEELLNADSHDCFCLEVSDSFGGYGIVGFASFCRDTHVPQLEDFVLSCRAAQKKIEATFLLWYAARHAAAGCSRLDARLIVTQRNAPLREVLDQIGFRTIEEDGDQRLLSMPITAETVVPDVLTLIDQDASPSLEMDQTVQESPIIPHITHS
ncbi:MAG: HAD-IIIC family phosphatase, partial [Planctomycetaceae bacterium]|nr:HAD-IIIC family phosphatase [Planctomycetaceae bacterium]